MDFGTVSLDGLVGTDPGGGLPPHASDPGAKHKLYGSGLFKQERSSAASSAEDEWRSSKLVKTDDFSAPKAMLPPQRSPTTSLRSNNSIGLFPSDGQQMLSFSSPKSDALPNSHAPALSSYFNYAPPLCSNYAGFNSAASLNGTSMQGVLAGARGPFTPSQWMELEHQALIYKYITSSIPIPSNLLIPIRKAFDSAGFSCYPGGLLRSNSLGWGSFHLGFSNTSDPEPGRCRRTDGKKWRCSRDAVADQKYCERHMNRGRHRSRKPVEGQTGHPVSGATNTTSSTKQLPAAPSASAPTVVPSGGASNSLNIAHQQVKNLQHGVLNLNGDASMRRYFTDKGSAGEKMQNPPSLSMLSPTYDSNSKGNAFMIMKEQFGLGNSGSYLNASVKNSSLLDSRNYGSSRDLGNQDSESHHSVRQFMDDWPVNPADRSAMSWPEIDMQSDRTHLSISIPMSTSDLISATSSPNHEKAMPSPLRLSHKSDPVQMNLGVGSFFSEPTHKQSNSLPLSWETSMGGPLGEVLHHRSNSASEGKNAAVLNLMKDGWDGSPPLGSSPTGVLQKTTFRSLSNSSAGSSPRAENAKTHEGMALCNDLLGSTLMNSSSLPAM